MAHTYSEVHKGPNRGVLYDHRYRQGSEGFHWSAFERPLLRHVFSRLSGRGHTRYLDFACGTGRILEVGSPFFEEIVGIDISGPMISQAQRKNPRAKLVLADVLRDVVDVGPFDVITLFRFLLNAEPSLRQGVLVWLRSVLSPDGSLLVNNHCNSKSVIGLMCRASNVIRRQNRHRLMGDREVEVLLGQCGFEIVESWGWGFLPMPYNKLLLPGAVIRSVEAGISMVPGIASFCKDRLYLARPV